MHFESNLLERKCAQDSSLSRSLVFDLLVYRSCCRGLELLLMLLPFHLDRRGDLGKLCLGTFGTFQKCGSATHTADSQDQ